MSPPSDQQNEPTETTTLLSVSAYVLGIRGRGRERAREGRGEASGGCVGVDSCVPQIMS